MFKLSLLSFDLPKYYFCFFKELPEEQSNDKDH